MKNLTILIILVFYAYILEKWILKSRSKKLINDNNRLNNLVVKKNNIKSNNLSKFNNLQFLKIKRYSKNKRQLKWRDDDRDDDRNDDDNGGNVYEKGSSSYGKSNNSFRIWNMKLPLILNKNLNLWNKINFNKNQRLNLHNHNSNLEEYNKAYKNFKNLENIPKLLNNNLNPKIDNLLDIIS